MAKPVQAMVHTDSRPMRSDNAPSMIWPGISTTADGAERPSGNEWGEADFDKVFGLVHLHHVPGDHAAEVAEQQPPEPAGAQRTSQGPVGGGPCRIHDIGLTRDCAGVVCRRCDHRATDRYSGRRRTSSVRLPATTSTMMPIVVHEARQPSRLMIVCNHGSKVNAPRPVAGKCDADCKGAATAEPVGQEQRVRGVSALARADRYENAERGVELPRMADDRRGQQTKSSSGRYRCREQGADLLVHQPAVERT